MKPADARRRILGRALLLVGAVAAGQACQPAPAPPPVRLVGALPADRFQFAGEAIDEVFRWELGAGNRLGAWNIRAEETVEQEGDFLHLAGSPRSTLVRPVNFEARNIGSIRVRMAGLRTGQTRLYWSRQGEPFSPDRVIVLNGADAVGDVYEFRVGEHPEWDGRIRNFRLDATTTPGERVSIASIVAVRANADAPDNMFERTWGFEVDEELRSGLLVSPDRSQTLTLSTPHRTRLYFSSSLLLSPRTGPARLTLHRVDGEERLLYDRTMQAPELGGREWVPAIVELGPSGEREIELRFSVDCPEAESCAAAFASIEARSEGTSTRPNVILISIDTLRADRMSLYGNDAPTTPRIDRWAAESGVTFERVVAAAPWTLPAHVSMFSGLDATTHNVNYNSPVPENISLLPERLHDAGYFTAAVTGGGFVAPEFGLWQGFDVYAHWQREVTRYWQDQTASGTELPSNRERASALLDELDGRPFFLFFHTYEVHTPFHPQLPYFEQFYGELPEPRGQSVTTRAVPAVEANDYKFSRRLYVNAPRTPTRPMQPEEISLVHAMYDSGVAFTDFHIGALLDELEARGLLHDTLIVLTSDHGEMLGEMGLAGHAYLHEENLLVPLVIAWPAGFEGGLRVDEQVRTVDIAPTVMELLGLEAEEVVDGTSLVPQIRGGSATREREALTYAASSNHGLSIRFPNDLKYVYDNSLWRPGPVDRLAPTDPSSRAAALDFSDRAAELRERAEQLLEARAGLHMGFVNETNGADLTIRFRGAAVARDKIKATRLQCRCAAWLPRNILEVRVPTDQSFRLQFEDATRGVMTIEVEDEGTTSNLQIELADIREPVAITRTDDGWISAGLRETEITRGIVIWWNGGPATGDEAPIDEELARRLRALGYLR